MSKRKAKLKLTSQTIRVPIDFKASLDKYVESNAMNTVKLFRIHGPAILELITTKQPAAQQVGAA